MAAISTGGTGGSRRRHRRRAAATCLLMALVDVQTSILLIPAGVHGHKQPRPPPANNIGSNLRSLLASGRRHCLSARRSCTCMAACSVLAVSSSPNRHRGGKRARALDAAGGSSTSKSVAAYHQDALLDEEATWIMEEEYRGASKKQEQRKRRRKQTKDTEKAIKSAEEHSDDDGRWWETDPWVARRRWWNKRYDRTVLLGLIIFLITFISILPHAQSRLNHSIATRFILNFM